MQFRDRTVDRVGFAWIHNVHMCTTTTDLLKFEGNILYISVNGILREIIYQIYKICYKVQNEHFLCILNFKINDIDIFIRIYVTYCSLNPKIMLRHCQIYGVVVAHIKKNVTMLHILCMLCHVVNRIISNLNAYMSCGIFL